MGKHSGRHAFREALGAGLRARRQRADRGLCPVQDARGQEEGDLRRGSGRAGRRRDPGQRSADQGAGIDVHCGSRPKSLAAIALEIGGERREAQAQGDGPVDATFNAIKQLVPHSATLALFQIHAVTEGTDAQAEVTVRLEENGKTVNGQAAETDTILASARAYVTALNKLLVKREKQHCTPVRLTTGAGCARLRRQHRGRSPHQATGGIDRPCGLGLDSIAEPALRSRDCLACCLPTWRSTSALPIRWSTSRARGSCWTSRRWWRSHQPRSQASLGGRRGGQADGRPHARQHRGDPAAARRRHRRFRGRRGDDQALHPQGAQPARLREPAGDHLRALGVDRGRAPGDPGVRGKRRAHGGCS